MEILKSLILTGFLVVAAGCGKTSKITTHVEARAIGDGEHITLKVVVPLTEKSMAFKSPVSEINPLMRGFVGSLMNIGATIGAGKRRLTLTQPIPAIPDDYLSSLKVKRIFFFIESNDQKNENFDFLRRLLVKVSSAKMPRDQDSWEPKIEMGSLSKKDSNFFMNMLKTKRDKNAEKWEKETAGLFMIRYNQEKKDEALADHPAGEMYVIQTETPSSTRKYLEEAYSDYFIRIQTLKKSILVELKKDPVAEEMFKSKITADYKKIEELGIGDIKPCDSKVCLDLSVPDQDLIPMLKAGNAVRIDTFLDPQRTPKSFQLKGFIEFEVKIKSKL